MGANAKHGAILGFKGLVPVIKATGKVANEMRKKSEVSGRRGRNTRAGEGFGDVPRPHSRLVT